MKAIAIESKELSTAYDKRYIIVDSETGEILDDAQGYGYKTKQKAYAAYTYKTRDRSKDDENKKKTAHIRQWLKDNKSFVQLMETCAFDIAKGQGDPDEKFNAAFVKKLLKEQNLTPDFTAGELLKVYKSAYK